MGHLERTETSAVVVVGVAGSALGELRVLLRTIRLRYSTTDQGVAGGVGIATVYRLGPVLPGRRPALVSCFSSALL